MKTKKRDNIKVLLDDISHKELKEFIIQYVKKSKTFKSDFEFYFADKDQDFDIERFVRQEIRKLIKANSKWGYIDYSSGIKLVKGLDVLYKKSIQLLTQGNLLDSSISTMVFLQEIIVVNEFTDDSHGYINDVIYKVISLLQDIISQSPIPLKDKIREFISSELKRSIYYEYSDVGYDLLDMYRNICFELNRVEEITSFIESSINSAINSNTYHQTFLVTILINIYFESGKFDHAHKLLKKYMHLPEIRKVIVERKIKENELEEAKKIISDGINIANQLGHNGTVKDWQKILLDIAEKQRDVITIRLFTEKLAFDYDFKKDYYKRWKSTFTNLEWPSVIHNKILDIEKGVEATVNYPDQKNFMLLSKIGPLYVEEQMHKALLHLVLLQTDMNIVLSYHNILSPLFPEKLIELYKKLLSSMAEGVSDRSAYINLMKLIKMIYDDMPLARKELNFMLITWKMVYYRRPAMVEEINYLLKSMDG